MPGISALERLSQEGCHESEAHPGCIVSSLGQPEVQSETLPQTTSNNNKEHDKQKGVEGQEHNC